MNLEPGRSRSHVRATPTSQPGHLGARKVYDLTLHAASTLRTQFRWFELIFPQAGPRAHVLARMPAGFSNLTPPAFRVRVRKLLGEIVSTV